MTTAVSLPLLFAAALLGGVVNAISGGGTLLTFPTLLSVGVAPVAANATSTVALFGGSFSAFWGYRSAARLERRRVLAVALPSALGGGVGAWVVAHVSDAFFRALVPWLILGATVLFMVNEPLRRWLSRPTAEEAKPRSGDLLSLAAMQGVIAVYGGFFGAGMGILLLAMLGLWGLRDLHEMNALKNLAAFCTNSVAAVTFALTGKVHGWLALWMAAGAVLGGFAGARLARKVGQRWVRRFVTLTGLVIGLYFLVRR